MNQTPVFEVVLPAVIRAAKPAEATSLGRLWALCAPLPESGPLGGSGGVLTQSLIATSRFRDCMSEGHPLFVAEVEDRVVGLIAAVPCFTIPGYAAELIAFGVEPRLRGRGIARLLLDVMQYNLAQRGLAGLAARVPSESGMPIPLVRLGADEIDRHPANVLGQELDMLTMGWPD